MRFTSTFASLILSALLIPAAATAASNCQVENEPFDSDPGGSHYRVLHGGEAVGFVTFNGIEWYATSKRAGGSMTPHPTKDEAVTAVCNAK
mgnify:CR=1 FL=1